MRQIADSLQANITASVTGVSSFAFTNANGISGSVATPTTTPNLTLSLGDITPTSVNASGNITATNFYGNGATLSGIERYTDTASLVAPYLRKSDTAYMLSNRLKISDTANMLTGYTRVLRFTDSLSAIQGRIQTKLAISDSLTGGYTSWLLTKKKIDSLGTVIGTKGTGTLTSAALILPSFITVSGSPITTSGTFVGTLANQTANKVFASATSGAAAQPTFRALVAGDIPALPYVLISDTAAMLAGVTLDRVLTNGNTSSRDATVGMFTATTRPTLYTPTIRVGTLSGSSNTSTQTGLNISTDYNDDLIESGHGIAVRDKWRVTGMPYASADFSTTFTGSTTLRDHAIGVQVTPSDSSVALNFTNLNGYNYTPHMAATTTDSIVGFKMSSLQIGTASYKAALLSNDNTAIIDIGGRYKSRSAPVGYATGFKTGGWLDSIPIYNHPTIGSFQYNTTSWPSTDAAQLRGRALFNSDAFFIWNNTTVAPGVQTIFEMGSPNGLGANRLSGMLFKTVLYNQYTGAAQLQQYTSKSDGTFGLWSTVDSLQKVTSYGIDSYDNNKHSQFGTYTKVDKSYVDSVITASPSGTVTSIATNTGSGITGGTITSTGTIAADTTTTLSTKANVTALLLGKLNLSDTASMLSNLLRKTDTSLMLSPYVNYAGSGLTKLGQSLRLGGLLSQNAIVTDSTFSMVFSNTKKINNSSKFGVNGELNLWGVTSDDNTQNLYSGGYNSMSVNSAASYNLNYKSVYGANVNALFMNNTGSVSGGSPIASSVAWGLFANTGTIANAVGFHIKPPAQLFGGTTVSNKITTYAGLQIDNLRDSSDIQSNVQNMYAINQKGVHDTSLFNGIITGNIINANTLGGTLSTAAQTNITSIGVLPANTTGLQMDFSSIGIQSYSLNDAWIGDNIYYNGGFKYTRTGTIGRVYFSGGGIQLGVAASGTAGSAASITPGITIAATTANTTINTLGTGTVQATAGVLSVISDSSVKTKHGYFNGSALDAVMKINKPQYWNYNQKSKLPIEAQKVKQFGLFADSVHYALGEQFAPTGKDGYYSLADRALLSLTIQALQEKSKKDDLKFADLQDKYDALLQRIIKLEKK
jgi:hypothetical protein